MLGALIGDMVGSRFEWRNYKGKDFALIHPDCRATDDSILTIAVADALLRGEDFGSALRRYCRAYPDAGYGGRFLQWAAGDDDAAGNSFGNGSAMRVAPTGWYARTLKEALDLARQSALPTHNHPEGLKGAGAVAAAIFLARDGQGKNAIRHYVEQTFGYDLRPTPDEIRPGYSFDMTCQGSVPEAFSCFLNSTDFEDSLRTAVSIGGDSDTLACITGSMAEAFYGGVPDDLRDWCLELLDEPLRPVVSRFRGRCAAARP